MKLLTKRETADLLGGVSVRTVERLIDAGKIEKVMIGSGCVRILEDDVMRYIMRQRTTNSIEKNQQKKKTTMVRRQTDFYPCGWKPGMKLV